MAIDKSLYRQVMGRFATGVAVLTTHSPAGPVGLTINSFCSVSLDPPLVLVCVDRKSSTLSSFRENHSFVVNILTDQQEHLSRGFATASKDRYEHFCYASYWQTPTGSPVIDDVLAFIDARIINEYPGGDHIIFLGQVQALGVSNHVLCDEKTALDAAGDRSARGINIFVEDIAAPLTYYRGQYRCLAFGHRQLHTLIHDNEHSYFANVQ